MVSPAASPVPVISMLPPLLAVPTCAKPVGAVDWTSTVNGVTTEEMTTLPLPAFSPAVARMYVPLSIDPPPLPLVL